MSRVLYIEGTQDMDNGDLRKAFSRLFEKELKGRMPRVVMGNGKSQTIDKFHSTPLTPGEIRYLLVDSDNSVVNKSVVCDNFNKQKPNRKLDCTVDNTYLMIQEVEAWILSQPDVLKKNKINVAKIPHRNVMEIEKPSLLLSSLYQDSGKEYHKVRDFSRIFPELNTTALKAYFDEFNDLITSMG